MSHYYLYIIVYLSTYRKYKIIKPGGNIINSIIRLILIKFLKIILLRKDFLCKINEIITLQDAKTPMINFLRNIKGDIPKPIKSDLICFFYLSWKIHSTIIKKPYLFKFIKFVFRDNENIIATSNVYDIRI